MAPIPYVLYFSITGFSFSSLSFGFSVLLPWVGLAAGLSVVLWLMNRELQKDIRRQFDEQLVLGYLEGYRLLFTPPSASRRNRLVTPASINEKAHGLAIFRS